jgi:CDP-glycerol glycerophosphotransferase (TagB/SpsB family)
MGEQVLRHLKASRSFDVLVKLHDHPRNAIDWRARLAPLEDEHLRVARSPDVIESLFAADLLISDASSVSNEYALLDRPMAFLDVPELIEEAQAREGSALDLDTWGRRAGPVVTVPADVVGVVADELEHPERRADVRQGIARDLFYNPGRATEAAVRWLREALVPA